MEWKKPEVLVLVRSNPEEAVLTTCKIIYMSGATSSNSGCYVPACDTDCDTPMAS